MKFVDLKFELTEATQQVVQALQDDGYEFYKEWANGIEMRKGKPFRSWLLAIQVAFPILLFPGYMRSIVNNLFGYRHRVLVSRDAVEPRIYFV